MINKDKLDTINHEHTETPDGETGAKVGAILGGIDGLLTGVGIMAIPGLNILAVGPLVEIFGGAIAGGLSGAATGSLAGFLVDKGFSKDEAEEYEKEIETGFILLAVTGNELTLKEVSKVVQEHEGVKLKHIAE